MLKNEVEFDLQVAELLVATGIVLSYDLDRAHASLRGGPGLREALVGARAVSAHMWDSAVQIIRLVHQSKLAKEDARAALNLVGNSGMPIDEALAKMGYSAAPSNPWEDKLRELTESGKYKSVK